MNTIMKIYAAKTKSEQEDFLKQLCRSYAPFLCAVIRQMGSEKDIFCKRLLNDLQARGE